MENKAPVQANLQNFSVRQFRAVLGETDFQGEEEIEARLQDLSNRLQNANTSSQLVRAKSTPRVYDPDFDLRAKVDAIRWMLRIAKHLGDPAREIVLLKITYSLDQLERAIDSGDRCIQSASRA